jgi:hypothetical protein
VWKPKEPRPIQEGRATPSQSRATRQDAALRNRRSSVVGAVCCHDSHSKAKEKEKRRHKEEERLLAEA